MVFEVLLMLLKCAIATMLSKAALGMLFAKIHGAQTLWQEPHDVAQNVLDPPGVDHARQARQLLGDLERERPVILTEVLPRERGGPPIAAEIVQAGGDC